MILFILLPVLLAVAITSGMVLFEKMNKFVFDSIEVEELEIGRKDELIPLLVSRTEKNMLGKTKTTKFYVDDKKNIKTSVWYADTGRQIPFNEYKYNSTGSDYPNREFLTNLESEISSVFNKKTIEHNINIHYENIIGNLDKELNDKFSKLEKEKEVVAKFKARIFPEEINNSDLEEFVSNVENVFKKGKQKSARR